MESLSPFPVTRFIHFGDFRYYYAYGNTPPDDLLQNAHGAEEPNILLLGCGDLRSCFYTLWKNLRSGISKHFEGVHFVLNDNSSAVIARDIIFLHLCLKMPQDAAAFSKWISAFWAIWYSHELRSEHQQVLDDTIDSLIALSKSSGSWSSPDNPLSRLVKFSSNNTLREVRQMWIMWHNREIGVKSVKRMNKDRLAELHAKIPDMEGVSSGVLIGSLCLLQMVNIPDSKQKRMMHETSEYMKTGSSFAEDVLVDDHPTGATKGKTTINCTFYERQDGKYTVHYGSVPFKCFYHTVEFSRQQLRAAGVSRSTAEQLVVGNSYFESLPFLSNSVQQFALWLRASAISLKQVSSSTSAPTITFTFHCSDAIDFCVHLQSPTLARTLNCATCFDLVYSSNLADHLALPNLVLAVVPLIKPGGFLFTTTLLYKMIAPTAEECINILFGLDIELIPVVLGVRCINHEGRSYSSVVSIQPRPYEYGHMINVKQWKKVLVWEKPNCLPLKYPALLSKYDVIAANLCSAVCTVATPLMRNVKGHGTINHLCVETAMLMLHCFASRVEDDTSNSTFWDPLAALILKRVDVVSYLHCLQTQALLHSIHLHLTVDEGTCPLCLKAPLTSYLSMIKVEVEIPHGTFTPTFLVYVHRGSSVVEQTSNLHMHAAATQNPDVHVIDSLNGVSEGKQLSLYFHVPISLITDYYNFTVVSYVRGQVLGGEINIPTILVTKRLEECRMATLEYSFVGAPPPNPAPVTALGTLQINAGDGQHFETVVAVSEVDVPYVSSMSAHGESPSEVQLLLRSHKYVITYPYPVDYDRLSIKISCKEKTVTVLASRMAYALQYEKPLFVVNTSDEFSMLRVTMTDNDMISYSGMQFTEADREIMQRCDRQSALMPAMINLKESMNFFFQCQKEHFFNIALPGNDVNALVVVQDRIFDLQNRSPAVDMAFCFLELSFVATVASKWHSVAQSHMIRSIIVNKPELVLLKKVLMYFAHRTVGRSLSKAKGHLQSLKRQKIDQYFTRAIIYPLFADPDSYVVDMEQAKGSVSSLLESLHAGGGKLPEEKPNAASDKKCCANCGLKGDDLKRCADCGQVRYCSRECQKKHWKIHKMDCKKSSSSSKQKNIESSSDICVLDSNHCNTCGKMDTNLKKCGACGRSWYCSQDCQRKDWKEHKKVCKALKKNVPASSSLTSQSDATETTCGGCKRESSSLRPCPCHKVAYCSTNCQRTDWIRHKVDCTAAK